MKKLKLKILVKLRNYFDEAATLELRKQGKSVCYEGKNMVIDPEWDKNVKDGDSGSNEIV